MKRTFTHLPMSRAHSKRGALLVMYVAFLPIVLGGGLLLFNQLGALERHTQLQQARVQARLLAESAWVMSQTAGLDAQQGELEGAGVWRVEPDGEQWRCQGEVPAPGGTVVASLKVCAPLGRPVGFERSLRGQPPLKVAGPITPQIVDAGPDPTNLTQGLTVTHFNQAGSNNLFLSNGGVAVTMPSTPTASNNTIVVIDPRTQTSQP